MNKIKSIIITAAVLLGVLVPVSVAGVVSAQAPCSGSAAECMKQGQQKVGGSQNTVTLEDQIKIVVNVLLFLLGAIAVIMIIIGGIRYATSNGDSSQTKAAKDTILYAVIGLIVAIMAYAIVNFIVGTAFK